MSDAETFTAAWWEDHYQEHGAHSDGPSPHLVALASALEAGTALDAGCGPGADAVWLARHGWAVTAVDVSPTVVRAAAEGAATESPDVIARITWVAADLTSWETPRRYDLVLSLYVHPDLPFAEFVTRLASLVAPGGTLLVVGHDPADPHATAHAPKDASIGPDGVTAALDPSTWRVEVAESRTQASLTDVVVVARRTG